MKKIYILTASITAAMIFWGCAPSRVEMDYGTSHKLAKYNQILNPDAEKNLKPVEGMDGKAAHAAVEKYQKGFEKTAPQPTFTFSIGGAGNSAGTGQ